MTLFRGFGGRLEFLPPAPEMTHNPLLAPRRLREALDTIQVLEDRLAEVRRKCNEQIRERDRIVRIPKYPEGWEDRGGRLLKTFPEAGLCCGDEVWVLAHVWWVDGSIFSPNSVNKWWVTADHEVFLLVKQSDLQLYFDPDNSVSDDD